MRDTDGSYTWTFSIKVKTKFDFQNIFSNLTFELTIKININNQKIVNLSIKIKIKNQKPM